MAIDYIKDVVLPQVKELESHASVHEAAAHGAYQMEEEAQEVQKIQTEETLAIMPNKSTRRVSHGP